ncbi:hypothetical protein N781_06915 [Pontibacillus halophilus JSM 076056 = DSM 19796]|uniref:DUF2254 domain-containing protein n=1 Tax=Pontibacillus halophilus JSM 076056 = DSM 19796 TaxID=1385510 RepID=A0A0A5GHG1_9BACI|nr:DUF2254 domain-containing protein [Pontibacillus halophilus]KGX90520.1 hypothetical protein N781_06915 [Pontibacillus halophilus JSM 076056 = DSM 19796]
MLRRILPSPIYEYLNMSKRRRKHELQMNIWFMPAIYIAISTLLVVATLLLDLYVDISQYTPNLFQSQASLTRVLVSSLIGAILTLSAYTLNSILIVLTTFSGQFSPRLLLNFISDRKTQHILGIFNGSFVYVLFVFLFISNQADETFVAVPVSTVLLAFVCAVTFIYFINHATTWMQVHNITLNMRNVSERMLKNSLEKEMAPLRTNDSLGQEEQLHNHNWTTLYTHKTGYVQLVDFKQMVEEAKKDDLIIRLEAPIGKWLLRGNPLLSYQWNTSSEIDERKYQSLIDIGHKQTEIQDIEHGLNKLSEVGIKALGNDDPKTAANVINQLSDLLLTISTLMSKNPYLVDENEQLRVIVPESSFEYYLYKGFGYIRHYATGNVPIITDIISSLTCLAKSIHPSFHQCIWELACNTTSGFTNMHIYELDERYLLRSLEELAEVTNNLDHFYQVKNSIQSTPA